MVPSCDSDDERRTLDRPVDMRAVRSLDTDAELAGPPRQCPLTQMPVTQMRLATDRVGIL